MAEKIFTLEEVITCMRTLANETKNESFRLRVQIKSGPSADPITLCYLDGLTVDHLNLADAWISQLFGGGGGPQARIYLTVFHASDLSKMIGSIIAINAPGELNWPLNTKLLEGSDWKGPRTLFWVSERDPVNARVAVQPQPGVAFSMSPSSATGRSPGGPQPSLADQVTLLGGHRPNPAQVMSDLNPTTLGLLEEKYKLEAKLASERAERDRDREIEKARAEMESRQRSLEERMERDRREMADQVRVLTTSLNAPKAESGGFEKILATLTPLVLGFMENSTKSRMAEAAAAREIAAAERESTKTMIANLMSKSPDTEMGKMIAPMVTAMSGMAQMSMQTMTSAAELHKMLNSGEEESTAVKFIREIGGMLGNFAQISAAKQKREERLSQRALPPTPTEQLAPHQPGQPFQPPARVAPVPVAQPVAQPRTNGANAVGPQGFNGLPPPVTPEVAPAEPQAEAAPEPTIVDEIEDMIRADAPVHDVAVALMSNLSDPDLQDELQKHEGDVSQVFQARLADWLAEDPAHIAYASDLLAEATKLGQESGLL